MAFDYISVFLDEVKLFVCRPLLPSHKRVQLEMQRGVIRTNCIDSLDRTNFIQELIGFKVLEKQLKSLKVTQDNELQLNSQLAKFLLNMYEKMGDHIALQYGGSVAHHNNFQKKKGFKGNLSEFVTSVKRHLANNFSDPSRQGTINLFLGMYEPDGS